VLRRLRIDLFLSNLVVGLFLLFVVTFAWAQIATVSLDDLLSRNGSPLRVVLVALVAFVVGFLIGEILDSLLRVAESKNMVGTFLRLFLRAGPGMKSSPYDQYVRFFRTAIHTRASPINALFFRALNEIFGISAEQIEKMTDSELRQLQEVLLAYLKQKAKAETLDSIRWHAVFGQFQMRFAFVCFLLAVVLFGSSIRLLLQSLEVLGSSSLLAVAMVAWAISYYSGVNTASLFSHRAKLIAHALVALTPNRSLKRTAAGKPTAAA
jgi:hypothetical protein